VKFHDNDATLQQETLGFLGVNLIYGAFYYTDNPRRLIESLYEDISKDKLEIDMIDFSGPSFEYVDNRLMSLQLVRNGMTEAVIFSPEGNNLLPADLLYKKNIFAVRGSFRPVTRVNIDMFDNGLEMFMKDTVCNNEDLEVLFEITISNLRASGYIDERDFLNRVDVLGKLVSLKPELPAVPCFISTLFAGVTVPKPNFPALVNIPIGLLFVFNNTSSLINVQNVLLQPIILFPVTLQKHESEQQLFTVAITLDEPVQPLTVTVYVKVFEPKFVELGVKTPVVGFMPLPDHVPPVGVAVYVEEAFPEQNV
jgi:hypothetical protein